MYESNNVSVTVNVTSFLAKYETVFRSHKCLLKFFQFARLVSIWGKLSVNIYASLV